jgi:hypothetical protein
MALQGPIPVAFGQVFPAGAYAAGAVEPVRDFEASCTAPGLVETRFSLLADLVVL